MTAISVPNPTILNSETSDVTKLTANDNAIITGLTDGTKDITIGSVATDTISENSSGVGVTVDTLNIKDGGLPGWTGVWYEKSSTSDNATGTNVAFSTSIYDINSEFDGTIFTPAASGWYSFCWGVQTGSVAWTAGDVIETNVVVTTAAKQCQGIRPIAYSTASYIMQSGGSAIVYITFGDTATLKYYCNRTGGATALNNGGSVNYITIHRVG
jgi:hypothetical protein